MIEVRNIHKHYDSLEVLRGIDLTITPGEITAIVGASGAGKTTLLQIMGTLERPDQGEVLLNGIPLEKLSEKKLSAFRNQHIGFIFQFHQLLPEFTALENVMIPALIARHKEKEAESKAKELLDMLNLSMRMQHKPNQLSGGEKQRVAVARALINQPSVVLADEPSGSLDTQHKAELHELLLQLQRDLGQTFVIVTHDPSLAQLAQRVVTMQDGLIV